MAKISIILPNWNGAGKLEKHLPAVLKAASFSKVEEVIVVDDHSNDGSVGLLKSKFPLVKVVEKGENTGFSSTVNLGVSKSVGELIVLLNTDADPEVDFIDCAISNFKDLKVFSVGCNAGGLWATARFVNGFFWHTQAEEKEEKSEAHITLWASAGTGVFKKKIWEELDGLDTLYDPFYVEDLDLGYRAWKRGYKNLWEPRSRVTHYKEKGIIESNFSKSDVMWITERNQLMFTWKNITSSQLIKEHKLALVERLIEHPKYMTVFLAALRKLPEILGKRRIEKKEAKLSDEQIFEMFQ